MRDDHERCAVRTFAEQGRYCRASVAGVGIEWMFAPNWSVKGEYQYIDLGSVTRTATALVTSEPGEVEGVTAIRRQNERFNTVRVGVNYHFGGPAVGRY
jgi:outer membrane immunogenic protein